MTTEIIIPIVISACMLVLAAATFFSNRQKDSGKDKAEEAAMSTKLDFIGNDIKDIKAEYRSTRTEMAEVRRIAEHASERADAAHARLDRAHIDIHD